VTSAVDDDLWSAVGDPTRRRMLDLLLVEGEGTATTLSRRMPVTRQAVAKHLAALHKAGLVEPQRVGRETHYRLTPAPLTDAMDWMAAVGASWDRRLARLAERARG
jgi:ArsR family transcriptional regulator, cadmium/lead-responsive transcriptional repressor